MAARGCMTLGRARTLAKAADAISALTCQALRGIPAAFSPLIQQVRPHPGQQECAANLLRYWRAVALSEPGGSGPRIPIHCAAFPRYSASRDAASG